MQAVLYAPLKKQLPVCSKEKEGQAALALALLRPKAHTALPLKEDGSLQGIIHGLRPVVSPCVIIEGCKGLH